MRSTLAVVCFDFTVINFILITKNFVSSSAPAASPDSLSPPVLELRSESKILKAFISFLTFQS